MTFMMAQSNDIIARLFGEWSTTLNIYSILLRLGLAFLFAAIVGCERSNKLHSAGLRTFILVTTAASMAMITDLFVVSRLEVKFLFVSAATVIGAAIISSYSILYSSRNQIKGLTTAVALWTCTIIGLLCGAGFYAAALIGFAALLCCLNLLPEFEVYLKNRSNHFEIHLELKDHHDLPKFISTIRQLGLKINDIELNPAYVNSGLSVFSMALTITAPELKKYKKHSEIIEALSTIDYVSFVEEIQ